MTIFSTRDPRFHDPSADDAYRTWLISRRPPPIIGHGGALRWRRLVVAARLTRNSVRGCLAAWRVAYVASEMRRVQRDLAQREARYPSPADARQALRAPIVSPGHVGALHARIGSYAGVMSRLLAALGRRARSRRDLA